MSNLSRSGKRMSWQPLVIDSDGVGGGEDDEKSNDDGGNDKTLSRSKMKPPRTLSRLLIESPRLPSLKCRSSS